MEQDKKAGKPYNAADTLAAICDASCDWGSLAPSLGKGWSLRVGDGLTE